MGRSHLIRKISSKNPHLYVGQIINRSDIRYRNLKILPLQHWMMKYHPGLPAMPHCEETDSVFNKPNWYYIKYVAYDQPIVKCWFETIIEGGVRAFEYDPEIFLRNLGELDCLKVSKRIIEMIRELSIVAPEYTSSKQYRILRDYDDQMTFRSFHISARRIRLRVMKEMYK